MAWNGAGIFQRTNGSYTGQTVWNDDANAGWDIVTTRHDTHDQDLAQGINNCLTKDGQNSPTANLPMNNYRHTGVSEGQARNQYATVSQLQDQQAIYATTVSGTNTITAILTPAITSYSTGARYCFKAVGANTGAVTVAFNGITPAVAVQRYGVALSGGEIQTNDMVVLVYDGTAMQLQSSTRPPLFVDRTNQRVGIGTTAPSTLLDVQGTAANSTQTQFSADTNGPRLNLGKSRGSTVGTNTIVQSGDLVGSIGFLGANGSSYDYAALISCEIAQTPGASNDMPGRLKFYTTPDGSSTVGLKFQIDTNGASSFYTGLASDSTTIPLNVVKTDTTVSPGNNYFIGFFVNNGATSCGRITSNGAGQAGFASTSDINLKENIVDLAPQLPNILALKPVEFDYKDGSGHQIGFIAQDVEQVYPDNVYTDPSGVKFLGDMSRMDARLVKAIQDLNDKVEALTDRVMALEV